LKTSTENTRVADENRNFVNTACEHYPCHSAEEDEWASCLFCFCPLYLIDCPGDFSRLPAGMKDCSRCMLPHRADGREIILREIRKQLFR